MKKSLLLILVLTLSLGACVRGGPGANGDGIYGD